MTLLEGVSGIKIASHVTAPEDLFDTYAAPTGVYDEFHVEPDTPRPHWAKAVAGFSAIGPAELSRRSEQAARLVRENGVTYNVYGSPDKKVRPWQIDIVPLIISADQWRSLSESLMQRARLLNLILADVFGPQQLLRHGLLPAELVFAHPGFQRPFHGLKVPDDCYLHLYGVELARSPDGGWWVMADRASAPNGPGYALENRIVVSRMLPDLIRDCQVERLAPFFITLQETLRQLSPRQRENPRIVIFSPGPQHPYYFEDAYLARYLGYTLVEGGDLAVRNDRVSLKTLGGLLPVDVILRRVNDTDCDPLELTADSARGVPGLVNAVRLGHVAVANALGSGLVESPVFMAFLPGLCRELLGEELKLPSVATWWCHDPAARKYVLEHLRHLVIKPAFRHSGQHEIIVEDLSSQAIDELAAKIKRRPQEFVAQENVARSASPVWENGRMRPGHVALRAFVSASGQSCSVMPGALVRAASTPGPMKLSISAGDGSKDAWILGDGATPQVTLLRSSRERVKLHRGSDELPSRVAENLYWLGRQLERADSSARLLRTLIDRLTSESAAESIPEVSALLRILAEQGQIERSFDSDDWNADLPEIEASLLRSIFNWQRPMSLHSTIFQLHRLASIVRDRISIDNWRIINRIEQEFQPPESHGQVDLSDVLALLHRLIIDLLACGDLASEGMTHGQAWRFLDFGRRVELSMQITSLVRNRWCLWRRRKPKSCRP